MRSRDPAPPETFLEPIEKSRRLPSLSAAGLVVGVILGLLIGLVYAWQIDPVLVRNVSHQDLHPDDKQAYVVVAAQEYAIQQDLTQFVNRMRQVEPNDNPFSVAADVACQLIRAGRVTDVTDIQVIRNLRAIYEPQGVDANCDVSAFDTPVPLAVVVPTATITPTLTITPAPSKTPTPVVNLAPPTPIPSNTPPPAQNFQVPLVETFCEPSLGGLIEVYVRDESGAGLAGVALEVTREGTTNTLDRQREVFYTGLKPERGDDYADYQMSAGESYRIGIQGEGQPTNALEARPCDNAGTLISYRVVIRRLAGGDVDNNTP